MTANAVLLITLREMCAIGHGWRMDWNDFDGRTLRDQLEALAAWAFEALRILPTPSEYFEGTTFKSTGSVRSEHE